MHATEVGEIESCSFNFEFQRESEFPEKVKTPRYYVIEGEWDFPKVDRARGCISCHYTVHFIWKTASEF